MSEFSGIYVPLITPFTSEGAVDLSSLRSLVRELIDAGIAGFVVCGTTGEPATLDEDEKESVLKAVLEACSDRPVIMGVSGIVPADVCEQLQRWNEFPIAGFMITPPYYVRPSQQAIIGFFSEIDKVAKRPIIMYDIPYRTGVQMDLETIRTLAQLPNICAVKDCGGDPRKTQALIADAQLIVLAGEDQQVFTTLCQGAPGAITASAHLHPELWVRMYRAIVSGNLHQARKIHHALAPLIDSLYAEPNPAPLKAVLANLGRTNPTLRLPMIPASNDATRNAKLAYERAGVLK